MARLGIFGVGSNRRPTITGLGPASESPVKDILVQVQEARTGGFLLGVCVNSDAGLSRSIVLNERNFDISRARVPKSPRQPNAR